MDRPGIDEHAFIGSLRALERINWVSRSAQILWPAIRELAREQNRCLTLLDVATGAGDIPLRLWHKARRAGISLELHGCDRNPHAVGFAQARARSAGADIRFFCVDALSDPFPDSYDVLTSSLFLHHLPTEQAIELLRRMASAARHLILINDLGRSRLGYLLAWAGTRLLSRSWVAHVDGPRSVEGAFTPREALSLAASAGLSGATVERRWPCRYLLAWKKI